MAYVPIFAVCAADPAVTALLGSNPTRLYAFGEAPQDGPLPYAVWQHIGGAPENYLDCRPDVDDYALQIDVYAVTGDEVEAVAEALRDVIETRAYIVRWGARNTDRETRQRHISFDVSWWAYRPR